jgi:starch phosphorylase
VDNIFIFGLTAEQIAERRQQGYDPAQVIENIPVLSAVLSEIGSGAWSSGDGERFRPIVDHLYQSDYFMVAADFEAYLMAQSLLKQSFRQRDRWARSAILNTAHVGWFSSDRAIRAYDSEIWHSRGG